MPFIPVPNVWQIALQGTLAGRSTWQINFYQGWSSHVTLTDVAAEAVVDVIESVYGGSGLAAFMSTGWVCTNAIVTDLTTATSEQFQEPVTGIVGTDAGQVLPGQTCGMIEWFTALRGRSFKGRTFLNGFTEGASDGLPTAGCVAALQAFADAMVLNFHSAGPPSSDLVVVSRFSGKIPNPNPLSNRRFIPQPRVSGIHTPITTASAETVWKTQRRRAFPG